ncbi:MAG: hypothetical protein QXF26_09230 [Candidatus Bathyarchaeia archaeon]
MRLDAFDRRIIGVLGGKGRPVALAELVRDAGFARSTMIIHLGRLEAEGLLSKEKKPNKGRGRPKFLYHLVGNTELRPTSSSHIIALEFTKLRKACKYEKGGYCKTTKGACSTINCPLSSKPK